MGFLKCEPVKIVLNNTAEQYSVKVTWRVPIPLLPKVENELYRMGTLEVIEYIYLFHLFKNK